MTTPARRYGLSDWLELHELSLVTCRSLLDAMPHRAETPPRQESQPELERSTINLESAWFTTVAAMRAFFPAQTGLIDLTFENTLRMQVPRRRQSRKAVTIDKGPNAYPTILYSFLGEPADLMVIAHEFAHALQIRASEGRFVSPVMREICAFAGEHALVDHVCSLDMTQHRRLCRVWDADNERYFGTGRSRLVAALSQPELAYSYAWNYPIARYLAIEVQKQLTPDCIWTLFEGQVTVAGLLRDLDLKTT